MLASRHAESLLSQTLYSIVRFSALPNAVALGIGRAPEALALCANGAVSGTLDSPTRCAQRNGERPKIKNYFSEDFL